MKVVDFVNYMDDFCPPFLAFDADNVGLIVGSLKKDVSKVLITLDVDESVANEAVKKNVDLIISHHPLMFNAIKRLTDSDPMQRTVRILTQNDISLLSAHTNLDCIREGLNDYMAQILGIESVSVIEPVGEYKGEIHGYGRIGYVPDGTLLSDMLQKCIEVFGARGVRYVGNKNKSIRKVAVNCGGGAYEMDICISMGADLFITGDVKYNPARDAYENGMAVIDAGHYETEHIVIDLLYNKLSSDFNDVLFEKSQDNVPVFNYYMG